MITGEANRQNLLDLNQICRKTLSVKFKVFFDKLVLANDLWQYFPPRLSAFSEPWILAIDGKWLKRQGVVMIYRDITHKENIFWSYHPSESYLALYSDLEILISLLKNNLPSGVVSDWKGSIVASVATYFGGIPHQRCLAHVVREAKKFLPKGSSFRAIFVLREIAKRLPYIKSKKEETTWKAQLIKWETIFGDLLREKTINQGTQSTKKWWYTHGNLRRAWNLLTKDWYPFFIHLDHPNLPNTNNSIEGVNGQGQVPENLDTLSFPRA